MPDRERIEELLAEFIVRREEGEAIDAAQFASEHDDVREELLRALDAFESTDAILPDVRDSLPRRIDEWTVLGFVAEGSFGRVLRVRRDSEREKDSREYALKLMHQGVALSPRSHERFRRESAVLRGLDDPGIVSCHGFGVFGACPYVVMDLVKGPNLAERIASARSQLTEPGCTESLRAERLELPGDGDAAQKVARLVAQVARSVHALHESGLLHRDLKPANVLLDLERDRPVLIDLGLVGGDSTATLTMSGDVLGTPAYMSPEQARGEACDRRSDVFGLGGILYELLTLEPPRDGRSSGSTIDELRNRYEHKLRSIDPAVPRSLASICERALAVAARWRHGSALALAEDLEAFAGGESPATRGKPLVQRAHELWLFRKTAVVTSMLLFLVLVGAGVTWQVLEARALERQQQHERYVAELESILERRAGKEAVDDATLERLFANPRIREGVRSFLDGDDSSAFATCSTIAAAEPGNETAAIVAGLAAVGDRKFQEAARLLAVASRLMPRSQLVARERMHALRQIGANREARAIADKLMGAPEELDVETLHEVARLAFSTKDPELGTEAIGRALAKAKAKATATSATGPSLSMLNTAAIIAAQSGDSERASELYDVIRKRDPNYVVGRFNEAYALDSACRIDEAREVYERIVALDPKHAQALASLAWLHAGSGRDKCEKCRAAFAEKPELYDVDLSEDYLVRAVVTSGGSSQNVLMSAITTAQRIARREKLRDAIRKLQAVPEITDRRLGRLTRALRELDK